MKSIKLNILSFLLVNSMMVFPQWIQKSPAMGNEIRAFIKNGSTFFVGTNGSGVYTSQNNDSTWTQKNSGISNLKVYSLSGNGSTVAAGTYGDGVLISNDNGNSWSSSNSGITVPYIYALGFSGGNIIAGTGGGGVFTTTNSGANWSSSLPLNNIVNHFYNSANDVYVCVGPYLYRSSDDGITWYSVVTANTTLKAIAETPRASGGTNFFVGSLDGMFLSTDNGTNWSTINNGLLYRNVNAVAVSGSNIFAGTESGGVFLSDNDGTSWTEINSGLPQSSSVRGLVVDGNYISAATAAGVVWRRNFSDIVSGVDDRQLTLPKNFSLEQNYPNPFNPSTTIEFRIAEPGYVSIKVFDALGREVAALVNEFMQPGNYNINFDASMLTSGIYFYQLKTSSFVQTKKMLLLK